MPVSREYIVREVAWSSKNCAVRSEFGLVVDRKVDRGLVRARSSSGETPKELKTHTYTEYRSHFSFNPREDA